MLTELRPLIQDPRWVTWQILRDMDRRGSYANVALDRGLQQGELSAPDRHLVTELVYGITRRQRTLEALITDYAQVKQQPPDLRRILHIGFYQLAYLDQIPAAAAIHTSVELARSAKLGSLTKVVNGILRRFLREHPTPSDLTWLEPQDPVSSLGIRHSFPDWILKLWIEHIGFEETDALCAWMNRSPHLDVRVNRLRTDPTTLQALWQEQGIPAELLDGIPSALRLLSRAGSIPEMPGYEAGWWSVQDASAQQVVDWLDPQPGEVIADCCAAPGGKSTHIAEKMNDHGQVWALDRHAGRLKRVTENAARLGLTCIRPLALDLAEDPLPELVDRALVDVPCSGLGTLHRHGDARWRLDPAGIPDLVALQAEILDQVAAYVKPKGILVYSTCTLNPDENERQIQHFLARRPDWILERDPVVLWPHRVDRDGFFMARLQKGGTE